MVVPHGPPTGLYLVPVKCVLDQIQTSPDGQDGKAAGPAGCVDEARRATVPEWVDAAVALDVTLMPTNMMIANRAANNETTYGLFPLVMLTSQVRVEQACATPGYARETSLIQV
ncbi:hypothetical protein GCM10009765_79310 [Fodinicola feengrottensis]|uniref:Uncharacterized protein n=1 Tax=Fodinicola feengrottensis TaxID=435914 RepID=A0ABN2J6M4_9ACTN